MKPPALVRTPALFTMVLCATWVLATAPEVAAAGGGDGEARLHQAYKACGKGWLKRARRLAPEQTRWMLSRHHAIYTVEAFGRVVAKIEVLSAGSFRDCRVETAWRDRETTVLVEYFAADGTSRRVMHNFSSDRFHFARPPKIMAAQGRALFSGVDAGGRQGSRWVELADLPRLYEEARALSPDTRLAATSE